MVVREDRKRAGSLWTCQRPCRKVGYMTNREASKAAADALMKERIRKHAEAIVAQAPPLSDEQIYKISALLNPTGGTR